MSTRFDLKYPYTTKWSHGYMVINGENRRHVLLISKDGKRSSTSYARYLMCVNLGRFLDSHEHVDHIDNDKENDVIENLQVLSIKENNRKEAKRRGKVFAEIKCPECGEVFIKRRGLTQAVSSLKGKITCCSRKCSILFKKKTLTKQQREEISTDSLLRLFRTHT